MSLSLPDPQSNASEDASIVYEVPPHISASLQRLGPLVGVRVAV